MLKTCKPAKHKVQNYTAAAGQAAIVFPSWQHCVWFGCLSLPLHMAWLLQTVPPWCATFLAALEPCSLPQEDMGFCASHALDLQVPNHLLDTQPFLVLGSWFLHWSFLGLTLDGCSNQIQTMSSSPALGLVIFMALVLAAFMTYQNQFHCHQYFAGNSVWPSWW